MTRFPARLPLLAAACALSVPLAASAQGEWKPSKPIRWIVPFAAGGAADIPPAEHAAYTSVFLSLLNLDETLTKE